MSARRRQRKREAGQPGGDWPKLLAVVFGGAMMVLAIVMALKDSPGSGSAAPASLAPVGAGVPAPVFSSATMSVASKFLCSCGACDVPELTDCTCPTAIEEKQFIERELGSGSAEATVVQAVTSRYGRIKPQFASIGSPSDSAPTPVPASTGATAPLRADALPATSTSLATEDDASAIASRFICACGRCTDHVLAECGCEHPRGAAEMKAFIDFKISQKQHSVDEIVEAVAYEYGHLR